jgi:hypothetical protein
MASEWVSLVPTHAHHGRRGVMLAASAVAGCFTFGVGAGPIPFVTVAVATVAALWIEGIGFRTPTRARPVASARTITRSLRAVDAPYHPTVPHWEVVESGGERRLELHWKQE